MGTSSGRGRNSRVRRQIRRLVSLLSLAVFLIEVSYAQTVTTIDDSNPFVIYDPVESWRGNMVQCDGCPNPPTSGAFGNSWHAGTHIVRTSDEDDEGANGDTDGDGNTSTSSVDTVSTAQSTSTKPPATPTSSAPPAKTSKGGDDDDVESDDDDDDSGKGKGKGKGDDKNKRRSRRRRSSRSLYGRKATERRDAENPFETTGIDEDDPGFSDPPVTATMNFTGNAVYLYAVIPLVPAPPQSTPAVTNVSFTLDGAPHGMFRFIPDPTKPGTPTAASPTQYIMGFPVFNATGLDDTNHTLVMSLGVDSIFFFDYANITSGSGDDPGTPVTAPNAQRTGPSTSDLSDPTGRKHAIATFAGAVGGSVGLLSVLALGLCISIKTRRSRAATRERRRYNAQYAQQFTAHDHGVDEDEEEGVFGGDNRPIPILMSQAGPTPFVPRYFPGSTPASPPPYVAEGESIPVPTMGISASLNREGDPVTIPSSTPMGIPMPPPMFDLQRINTGSSYADRPPPTPPDLDVPTPLFGANTPPSFDIGNSGRNMNGGIVGPLPSDSPVADENEPMIGQSNDYDTSRHSRRSSDLRPSSIFSTSASSHAHSVPNGTSASSSYHPYNSGSSRTSSAPSPPPSPKPQSLILPPGLYDLSMMGPSASTSMPSLATPPSFTSVVAQREQTNKPTMTGGSVSIPYPALQPARIPLPPSLYGYDVGSQDTLERHDSRT